MCSVTAPEASGSSSGRAGVLAGVHWTGRRSADDWRTSLLLLLLVLVSIPGLHSILSGAGWFAPTALVTVLVLGAAAVTRLLSRRAWLPPLVAAVVLLAAMTAFFAPGTAFLAVIPTGDTFTAFGTLFQVAGESINRQSLPAEADTGITFLLCLGVGGIAFAADALAIALRAPALAALPVFVLLEVPASVRPGSTDALVFLAAAVVYLVLLRVGSRRGQGILSLAIAAAVMVVALVVPVVLPAVDDSTTQAIGAGSGTGVNPVLSLGNSLRQSSTKTVLKYSTASGKAEYLRMVSIVGFQGSNWEPENFSLDRKNTVAKIDSPPGLTSKVARVKDTTRVSISTLATEWLPLPYPSTSVTGLSGAWYFDSTGLAVQSPDHYTTNEDYTVSNLQVTPTVAQLRSVGASIPQGMPEYLQVPRDLPPVVGNTARQVVADAGAVSDYDKALALQSYFHDGEFVYSETAPVEDGYDGTGEQVIAKFLAAKSGYCIHFASAMAMMARVLDIPSRISVGFLPGTKVKREAGKATYAVSMRDLHAWPELYFTGVGWVRFEPTVSRGDVPGYATVAEADAATAAPTDTSAPSAAPSATRAPAETVAPTTQGRTDSSGTATTSTANPVIWVLLGLLLVVAIGLVPAVVRALQRSRRLRRLATARAPALLAWTELAQTSEDLGARVPETLTPRETAAWLVDGALEHDPAVERLLEALEHERFARGAGAYPGAAADLRAALGSLRAPASPRARLRAALLPASIWRVITPGR